MVVTLDEPVLESEWLDFYIVTERCQFIRYLIK